MGLVILPDTKPPVIRDCYLDEENLVLVELDNQVNKIALSTLKTEELIETYGAKPAFSRVHTSPLRRTYTINFAEYRSDYLRSHAVTAAKVFAVSAVIIGFISGALSACLVGGVMGLAGLSIFASLRVIFGLLAAKNAETPQLLRNVKAGVENLDKILALKEQKNSSIDFGAIAKHRDNCSAYLEKATKRGISF